MSCNNKKSERNPKCEKNAKPKAKEAHKENAKAKQEKPKAK